MLLVSFSNQVSIVNHIIVVLLNVSHERTIRQRKSYMCGMNCATLANYSGLSAAVRKTSRNSLFISDPGFKAGLEAAVVTVVVLTLLFFRRKT